MSDWKTYKLKEITTKIGSGATPRGGKDAYLDSGEYSLIRSQNVLDFTFSYNGLAFINLEQANQLNNVTIEEKDVLLNITGDSVARVCQVPKEVLPARVNQHVAIIRPDTSKLSPEFLKYYLLNPKCKNQLLSFSAVGATRNALTKGMIEDLDIQIPTIKDQQRIASILSSLDDKIELNRQTNQTLEGVAQTLFQEMCVPKGEELPDGWRVGVLFDICTLVGGGTPKTDNKDYWDNGTVDWISAKDITPNNGSFITKTEKKITELGLKNSSAKLLPSLATIISARGTVGNVCIISKPMTISQSNYAFVASTPQTEYYLFCIVRSLVNELKQRAYGTIFDTITTTSLSDLEVITPPKDILQNFNNIISPIFEQIRTNIQENQTLITLRDSLLPKLMKGEIEI